MDKRLELRDRSLVVESVICGLVVREGQEDAPPHLFTGCLRTDQWGRCFALCDTFGERPLSLLERKRERHASSNEERAVRYEQRIREDGTEQRHLHE